MLLRIHSKLSINPNLIEYLYLIEEYWIVEVYYKDDTIQFRIKEGSDKLLAYSQLCKAIEKWDLSNMKNFFEWVFFMGTLLKY
jgi:hypothetical protein